MAELSLLQYTSLAVKFLSFLIDCTCFQEAKLFTSVRFQRHMRQETPLSFFFWFNLIGHLIPFIYFKLLIIFSSFLQFFAQAGFPCPALRNPSDHFLRCINSDFDKVKATLKGSMKLRVSHFLLINCFRIVLFFVVYLSFLVY